jgi:hypothetical protein
MNDLYTVSEHSQHGQMKNKQLTHYLLISNRGSWVINLAQHAMFISHHIITSLYKHSPEKQISQNVNNYSLDLWKI